MTFVMKNDKRNKENLNKLADNTKNKAYQLYQYCFDNNIQILIYETIRTVAQQKINVAKGASKTMQSYHIVGQALDWVLIDSKGNAMWSGYNTPDAQKVIKHAKSIGFESGYDWGWDAPHLQLNHKGYGTDTFGKLKVNTTIVDNNKPKDYSKSIGYNLIENSKVFRIHTTAFKCEEDANKAKIDYVKNKYLGYAEVFGSPTHGYRLQSGKYNSLESAENAIKKMVDDKIISYASIVGNLA